MESLAEKFTVDSRSTLLRSMREMSERVVSEVIESRPVASLTNVSADDVNIISSVSPWRTSIGTAADWSATVSDVVGV